MNDNHKEEPCETADEFQARLSSNLTAGFSTMGVALGSRLGLFDVMSRFGKPATSQEIADAAGFKERYVREWLGLVCTSKIVNLDASGKKYYIPEHRRAALTDPNHLGVFSWTLPMMAGVEVDIAECFKLTGPRGVPYSKFPYFQEWREKNTSGRYQWSNLSNIIGLVPGLLQKLEQGIEMVDMGCGRGSVPLTIAEQFPKSKVWGLEIDEDAMDRAKSEAKERDLPNAHFKVQDICNMPPDWTNKFDFVCMLDVAHDVPHTTKMFKEVLRVLKPGGSFLMQDVDMHTEVKDNMNEPEAPIIYGLSLFHCMPVSLNIEGGEGWGTAWGREAALGLLEKTGFVNIQVPVGLNAVCQKPES